MRKYFYDALGYLNLLGSTRKRGKQKRNESMPVRNAEKLISHVTGITEMRTQITDVIYRSTCFLLSLPGQLTAQLLMLYEQTSPMGFEMSYDIRTRISSRLHNYDYILHLTGNSNPLNLSINGLKID